MYISSFVTVPPGIAIIRLLLAEDGGVVEYGTIPPGDLIILCSANGADSACRDGGECANCGECANGGESGASESL